MNISDYAYMLQTFLSVSCASSKWNIPQNNKDCEPYPGALHVDKLIM